MSDPSYNVNEVYRSKWLRAQDLQGDTVLTIAECPLEKMEDGEYKLALAFKENVAPCLLNKTNANTVTSLYGPLTANWIGKQVTLFRTQTDFQGKQVPCIRVRLEAPDPNAPHPATSQPAGSAGGGSWPPSPEDDAALDGAPDA